ncbi:MAG: UDP-N-acetylmuramoyl-tripeptide--D-alanyl-D-alanine ligase [Bacteroidales bacterium]|nr:UDP-N-acetylmuramoyl-tripeptide--D-alanyl-D-alanine ligase [Bacteroidales bacterium]MBN2757193.1 UDP-N-acetylmuramoyl-tripeptide--D-alanyl-D-alanine ligase [Bacteroidales bacterium]
MKISELHKIFLKSEGIATDTRKVNINAIFFALKGENFDGNKFALKAIDSGAVYSIIDNKKYFTDEKTILVDDVLKTLQNLAKFHRDYLAIPILAITGTNGKTTTKELIREVLSIKYNVSATIGNLNNHIGVPLTLLSMNKKTEIGIVEMGANHVGEIKALCEIANPNFGLITNIGRAHIQGFGSFEGVIKAKSEMYDFINQRGDAVFLNIDDQLLSKLSVSLKKISYGSKNDADYIAQTIDSNPFLKLNWQNNIINTKLVGSYNFYNVLAAIAVGSFFEVPDNNIIEAIENYSPQNNRSQLLKTQKNTLIVDAYNANPSSMNLAIKNFVEIKKSGKVLILGDMFELGNDSIDEHIKIIDLINNYKFDNVILVGKDFFRQSELKQNKYLYFKNTDELVVYIKNKPLTNKYILLKASRGIMLEKVIEYL